MYGTFIYSGVITHNSALHFMPLHILRTHCRYKITVIIYRCHGKKSEVTWPISKVFKIISEYMHSIKVFKETLFCWELCDKLFSLKESLQIGRKLVFSAAPFQVYGMDVVTNCCALTSGWKQINRQTSTFTVLALLRSMESWHELLMVKAEKMTEESTMLNADMGTTFIILTTLLISSFSISYHWRKILLCEF